MALFPTWMTNALGGAAGGELLGLGAGANPTHTHTVTTNTVVGPWHGNLTNQQYQSGNWQIGQNPFQNATVAYPPYPPTPPTPKVHNMFKCDSPKEAFEKAVVFVTMLPEDQTLIVVGCFLIAVDKFDPAFGVTITVPGGA